ncbi:hypothetical protein BDN71DRAFT_284849 [Pleurotus eryngii]|uniref:Uncharacterized protein n=1 Tax=Pleurotus eryngii TaxID=5323 RepID=A0A9P5ZLE5_PLEER|nr:hypothetical protein BDN71DRAFT_284849 [Pleurotus eryngii]
MDPMGSGGGNLYVCRNYCSHMNKDRDTSMSICMQSKKRCKEGEWNFVYLRWGVYLQNGPNTLWLFDANHIHGSTMPSKSTLMRQPYLQREQVPNDAQSQQGGDPQEQGAEGGNGEGAQDQQYLGDQANALPPMFYGQQLRWIIVTPDEASTGCHVSYRHRDFQRASQYQRVRRQLPAVSAYWNQ